jgi:hypothetical protein
VGKLKDYMMEYQELDDRKAKISIYNAGLDSPTTELDYYKDRLKAVQSERDEALRLCNDRAGMVHSLEHKLKRANKLVEFYKACTCSCDPFLHLEKCLTTGCECEAKLEKEDDTTTTTSWVTTSYLSGSASSSPTPSVGTTISIGP